MFAHVTKRDKLMNTFKYNIGYALSGGFIKGFAHLGNHAGTTRTRHNTEHTFRSKCRCTGRRILC